MIWKMVCKSTMKITCFILWWILVQVRGHGRLIEPPSRSSMWRFGFKTEPNYNDNELFCGGFMVQQSNGGKCGICGDNYQLLHPRPNEAGGKYGKGVIARSYNVSQHIKVTVELTANHQGYFEFKLCPNNNPKKIATQECLDQYPLQVVDGQGSKYKVLSNYPGYFDIQLHLPPGLTCSQCVLQWRYTSGNNWGACDDGTSKVGCGPQETFMGCADVAIGINANTSVVPERPNNPITGWFMPVDNNDKTVNYKLKPWVRTSIAPSWVKVRKVIPKPTSIPIQKTTSAENLIQPVDKKAVATSIPVVKEHSTGKVCVGVGAYKIVPGMDNWCILNCKAGFCPETHCSCA